MAHVTGHRHNPQSFRCWMSHNVPIVTQTTAQTTEMLSDKHTPENGQSSGKCISTNSASASTSASASASASTAASRRPSAGPPQSVHSTLLAPQYKAKLSGETEDPPESAAIKSGRTQLYHNWWQQDPSNICLFGAHLIGESASDAEAPSQYASMALTDLAFCRLGFMNQSVIQVILTLFWLTCSFLAGSTWGSNRVQEHMDTEGALLLILPVKTDPAIVQQVVAGLSCGSMDLHMGNVEPIVVLANAIGVSHLSSICNAGMYALCKVQLCLQVCKFMLLISDRVPGSSLYCIPWW